MNVSFVIIAHKSSGTLESCLASVEKIATDQDELILVLNNPDLRTRAIAEKHARWKLIDEKNPGPAFARNAGARHATKELVCFLDSDVGLNLGWHQAVENKFNNPWIVAGQFKIVPQNDGSLLSTLKRFQYLNFDARFFKNYADIFPIIDSANLVIRREWFLNLQGFNTDLRYLEDTEFSLRLLREGADLFFDTHHMVTEFTDSEETLWGYIFKQFDRCKYLPKVMELHGLDFHFSNFSTVSGDMSPPGIFLKASKTLIKIIQFAGIACTPFPIYLSHQKAGRIARNKKKSFMMGTNPTVRSIWVNKEEKFYNILLRRWETKQQ